MDVNLLKTFVEVMRRGSFAAVARDHNSDPSTVSRSIASLEKELGVRLFQRTTRRLAPTEAGIVYFERIEPVIGEMDSARSAACEVNDAPRGNIRFTASVSFGQKCITPLLPEFRRRYPDLSVDLVLTDTNLDLVAEWIDLAVRLGPQADSLLIGRKLFDTRYRVCASPDYLARSAPISLPQDLIHHNCVLFPFSGYRTRWIFKDETSNTSEVPVNGNLIISNAVAIHQCTLSGLGPALLANWLVDEDISSGKLVDLFPMHNVTATDFDTAAWLLYPSRNYLALKIRVLIDFLRESIGSRFDPL